MNAGERRKANKHRAFWRGPSYAIQRLSNKPYGIRMFDAGQTAAVAASSGDRSNAAVRRSALVPRLRGVNGNSLGSRRYREVAMALADDHGGPDALDEPTRVLIRQAAGLTVEAENMQRRIARGENVNHEDLVRVARVLNQQLRLLGVKKAVPRQPTLAEYLASKQVSTG